MHAEIISTGTEIMRGNSIDTNFSYISKKLLALGVVTRHHYACADNLDDIANCIRTAFRRSGIVILTGGLGPTTDDYTRIASAKAFGTKVEFYSKEAGRLKERFKRYNMKWTDTVLNQAYFPKGSKIIPNHVGSAAGFYIKRGGKYFFTMPGVPKEMEAMLGETVLPILKNIIRKTFVIKTYKTFGVREVEVEDKVKALLTSRKSLSYGLTAKHDSVNISFTVDEEEIKKSTAVAKKIYASLKRLLGDCCIGDSAVSLEEETAKLLMTKKLKLAIAESFTGGLISHKLTNIAGISSSLISTVVAYGNEAKVKLLNIPRSLITKYGAVSEQVALAMAKGALISSKADVAISTTGIAGPTGATKAKPIGLSYVALCHKSHSEVRGFAFTGDRETIKERGANWALNILRLYLLKL